MNKLFPHDLTPQRRYLLRRTWENVERGTLRTSDLQLCLLHFREIGLSSWSEELGSAVAHTRRNRGLLWPWALNVWATQLYYNHLDRDRMQLGILPLDIFRTVELLIKGREEWQLAEELSDIYPNGITKSELLATLTHLYSPGKVRGNRWNHPCFVYPVSQGNANDDLQLMRRIILYCEPIALNIPPLPIDGMVDDVDRDFQALGISSRSLTVSERVYLQLHILVCFHNMLFDVESDVIQAITGIEPLQHEAMLSVSTMEETLGLDIAFYYLEEGKYLEPADMRSPDGFERFSCPLVSTRLDEKAYLLESDTNIRSCLYNHPLEVRHDRDLPVVVALERNNGRFKPTRSRRKQNKFKSRLANAGSI